MTTHRSIEKWGPLVLGLVCVFIVIKLVGEINGSPQRISQTRPRAVETRGKADSRHNPGEALWDGGAVALHLDQLKAAEERPAPTVARNPFGYPPPPPPPGARQGGHGAGAALPPPPPPIPLKALGYSQDQAGNRQAYLSNQDEVFAVHSGDKISNRYKILSITPRAVRVKDLSSGERALLPIPQSH
jgi:hypothetical protein